MINENRMIKACKVAEILGVSKSYAYKIVSQLNEELKSAGYLTIPGKIDVEYLYQRFFPDITNKTESEEL